MNWKTEMDSKCAASGQNPFRLVPIRASAGGRNIMNLRRLWMTCFAILSYDKRVKAKM
jgi:hypothetical protein